MSARTPAHTQRPGLAGAWNIAALGLALYFLFSSLAATDTPKDAPFWAATGTLAADAPWQTTELAVVPPYTPHRVACDERLICSITIEPETVDEAALPAWLLAQVGAVSPARGLRSVTPTPAASTI